MPRFVFPSQAREEKQLQLAKALYERSTFGKELLGKVKGSTFELTLEVLLKKQMTKRGVIRAVSRCVLPGEPTEGGETGQTTPQGPSVRLVWPTTRGGAG